MSKKLTHEEFLSKVAQSNQYIANGDIEIIGVYIDRKSRIECRCNIHDCVWSPYVRDLYKGCGCMQCGTQKIQMKRIQRNKSSDEGYALNPALSHNEFICRLNEKNAHFANQHITVLDTYVNMRTRLKCLCNICQKQWEALPSSLILGHGCLVCGIKTAAINRRITHDEFVRRVAQVNDEYIVLGEYMDCRHKVKMQCKNNHVWDADPQHLFNGVGCPYCACYAVWVGFNDLLTTRPDIAQLMKNPNDGYKYSQGVNKRATLICPQCGYECVKSISAVCADGFKCPKCSDGISYPNKFGRAFLDQLTIKNYICEYSPSWAKPYRYDNYFEYDGKQYIVEMDGAFHYIDKRLSKQSLQERQKIDETKSDLARQHGIRVIRIDCLESSSDYISRNICNSELGEVFDLSQIDWGLCDKKAQKNIVKEVCDLYASGTEDLTTIQNLLHISQTTVRRYLKKGTEFGWCDYVKVVL